MNGSITYDARLPGTYNSGPFSPYHDDDPVLDFFLDDAQRLTSIITAVFVVHLALVFILSPNFIMPDLKPDEPEIVPVQIITFDPTPQADPIPTPAPEVIQPAIPAPAVKPKPRPAPPPQRPEPEPEPEPEPQPIITPPQVQPEPIAEPIPEPIIEPEPVIEPEPPIDFTPPPEIISQPVIEPDPIVEPEPIFEPEPVQDPIIEDILPDPIPAPLPEPIYEAPEPVIVEPAIIEPVTPEPQIEIFEPTPEILDPIIEEAPLFEEPIPEIEPEIEFEPAPFTTTEPLEQEPLSGALIEDVVPELPPLTEIIPEPLPLPEPEPDLFIEPPSIETIDPPDVVEVEPVLPDIITTAPTILASPEAPTTPAEAETAVPQSQSDPMRDLLRQPTGLPPATPGLGSPLISGPLRGGGNEAIPNGGTRRAAPGTGGWTLAPSGRKSLGAGYDGINLDIRCREAERTHEDCPAYLKQFQGRNSAGWESFKGMAGTGTDRGETGSNALARRSDTAGQIGGGQNIWKVPLGDNSFNNGGPSTTILDDIGGFNNQVRSNRVMGTNKFFEPVEIPKTDPVDPNDWVLQLPETEPRESDPLPEWMLPAEPEN